MSIDIESIKRANPLDVVVEKYTGQQIVKHKIHCPLHSDSNPSMHIYDDGGFKCFQCGVSGDVIDFVGYYHFGTAYDPSTHFTQAVDKLGNLDIAQLPQRPTQQPVVKPKPQLSINLDTLYRWHETMPASRREYWHSRGLTDATVDRFMLGWDGRRYTIPHLYRLIPFGCKRRKSEIDDKIEERYVCISGSRSGIFNADILQSVEMVVICEGEIDAMLLEQWGFPAVTSTAGAATWKPDWVNLFSSVRKIFILYDNDKAGLDGALHVQSTLRRAKIVRYPEGVKDCGELFDKYLQPVKWLDKELG